MKKIVSLVTGKAIWGILRFYSLIAFLVASFCLGLLLKFGVLTTPVFITRIHIVVGNYILKIITQLIENPLDLLFTLLAGTLMGLFFNAMFKDARNSNNKPQHSDKLAIRGPAIQSRSTVEAQLNSRRLRAQEFLDRQYAKFNVTQ